MNKNKIEIEIPEGKKAEWVNGVLTLVDKHKKSNKFEVGETAILNRGISILQSSGDFLPVNAGTEVEIVKVSSNNMYKIKYQDSTAMILGRDLDKIEYKFNVGDEVLYQGKCYKVIKRFKFDKPCYLIGHATYQQVMETELESYKPDIAEPEPIKYKFNVGDIAILKNDTSFNQGDGVCLISAGTEVEIVSVSDYIDNTDKLYGVRYQNTTSIVRECDLIPVKLEQKVEFKFKIGDKVSLINAPLAVFTIVEQIIKDGKPYYGVEGRPNCLPYEESELMHYDNKKVEYKFKVGDKVRNVIDTTLRYTVKECYSTEEGQVSYMLEHELGGETALSEKYLELIPQNITDRIKTFDDACKWCRENGKSRLVEQFEIMPVLCDSDIDAYLKLRIITCALNEGWEPTFETYSRYAPVYSSNGRPSGLELSLSYFGDASSKLCFKSGELALYAATQFKDIYLGFCG